jgi:hypothetical protein
LYASLIRKQAHESTKSVYFSGDLSFGNTTNGRIARHASDILDTHGE